MTTCPWTLRAGTAALSLAALVALAAPSRATTTTSATAAGSTIASTATAAVDYFTWQQDCQVVMEQALPYLKWRIANPLPGEKQAIVLDVDNTSLESDFGYRYPQPANRPVLEAARYAQEHGVSLFFVSARLGILYSATRNNLERVGYQVSGLHVRRVGDLFKNVAEYKTAKRVEIEADGYTIIANIGNRATDLSGGHAEKTFKLPDYDGQLS